MSTVLSGGVLVLPVKWCVTTEAELKKCQDFALKMNEIRNRDNLPLNTVLDYFKTPNKLKADFSNMPEIQCVQAIDV